MGSVDNSVKVICVCELTLLVLTIEGSWQAVLKQTVLILAILGQAEPKSQLGGNYFHFFTGSKFEAAYF